MNCIQDGPKVVPRLCGHCGGDGDSIFLGFYTVA